MSINPSTMLLFYALITGAAASGGDGACPCLTTYPAGVDPSAVQLSGKAYNYPSDYGLSSCRKHDENLEPFCTEATPPSWCTQQWCYIDVAKCTKTHARSGYFPDNFLYYSYHTCGTANTFESWFGEAGSGETSNSGHTLVEMATVVGDYVKNTADVLENNEWELRQLKTPSSCSTPSSCPCKTCSTNSDASVVFGNQSITLGTTTYTTRNSKGNTPETDAAKLDVCLAGIVGEAFMRVAAAEARPEKRLGYAYGGLQELGTYMQWPGVEWCTETYDPRFRPWYAAAASGPKDMIVIIDRSGSMSSTDRMALAIQAGKKVIDTLTEADFATVISFSDEAQAASKVLLQATEANKKKLVAFIDHLSADGGTNFGAAFSKALDIFEQTGDQSSACHKVVLFLSDGEPTQHSWDDSVQQSVNKRAATLTPSPHILTYAFGGGADFDLLKKIACEYKGIAYQIADGGKIGDVMAGYYKILSPLSSPCQVRWTQYTDILTGEQLTAACLASYTKPYASAKTSCKEGEPDCIRELLAVTCIDMGVMASMTALQANSGWSAFWERVQKEQKVCPSVSVSEAQMQFLRRQAGDNAVCSRGPEPKQCMGTIGEQTDAQAGGTAGLIAGIVGGAVGLVLLASLVGYRLARLKKKRKAGAAGRRDDYGNRTMERASEIDMARAESCRPSTATVPTAAAVPMGVATVPMGVPIHADDIPVVQGSLA